jgi:8-hydroxy-5-deazaflavin:NADPH oxidoreductase
VEVGIVGAGNIGGGIARQLAAAGHTVLVSFARDPARLVALESEIGGRAVEPQTAALCEVVVLSVPWDAIDIALAATGSLSERIVLDTTNQYSRTGSVDLGGRTAARFNADRMPGARYTKSFNTLTARFQAEASRRTGDERVVQWVAGNDDPAKEVVAQLVDDAGFVPIDLGEIDNCHVMEAPRRKGAVYGEEYRRADAESVIQAVRNGASIPEPPSYT